MITPGQKLRDRIADSDRKLRTSDEDGLLALALKKAFGLWIWRWPFRLVVGAILSLNATTNVPMSDAHADNIVRRAMDRYMFLGSLLLLVTYVAALAFPGEWPWWTRLVWIIPAWFVFSRLMEIFGVLCELHLHQEYKPTNYGRAVLNTFWHFGDVVIAFATFYTILAKFGWDSFKLTQKEFLASIETPLYFSFQVITTGSMGEFAPESIAGRIAVCVEVGLGLILIVVAIQRALSSSR